MTIEQHLEQMMLEADDINGSMNLAGFYYLGHMVAAERARVSLAFASMVREYARQHGFKIRAETIVPEIGN